MVSIFVAIVRGYLPDQRRAGGIQGVRWCSAVYLPSGSVGNVVFEQCRIPVLAISDGGDRNGCHHSGLHPHGEAVLPSGMNEGLR